MFARGRLGIVASGIAILSFASACAESTGTSAKPKFITLANHEVTPTSRIDIVSPTEEWPCDCQVASNGGYRSITIEVKPGDTFRFRVFRGGSEITTGGVTCKWNNEPLSTPMQVDFNGSRLHCINWQEL